MIRRVVEQPPRLRSRKEGLVLGLGGCGRPCRAAKPPLILIMGQILT